MLDVLDLTRESEVGLRETVANHTGCASMPMIQNFEYGG